MWDFQENGQATTRPAHNIPTIKLTLGYSPDAYTITQKDCKDAHVSLGHWIAPNNDTRHAAKILMKKGQHFPIPVRNTLPL